MIPTNRSDRHSSTSSILMKARQFGIFSVIAIATNTMALALSAEAQISTDGSTATEVKGNVISPTGAGTVSGGNLYNSFDQFNVPNSGVIFNTGTSSVDGNKVNNIINRVTGDSPSSILGTIESRQAFPNANLFLLNPNGVVFSPNAKLDIGGSFNVSTGTGLGFDQNQKFIVDKNSLSFPSGDPKNIQFAVSQPAAIINQGNLSVAAGKNIAITAGTVVNTGKLSAPQGNIGIAAVEGNSQVELRSPDLVLGLSVSKNAIPTTWNGQIATLPKLAEALTGKVEQANQVVVKPDSSIALVANPSSSDIAIKDGMAIASGNINVSSDIGKGGSIGIFGNQVGLVNAQVNASGATGGGTVLIGGDFQGKGIAPNALQTYIDGSSKILANGLLTGDGGRVIVWADRSTQFLGAIAARGGEISGNGGFVEVSGKEDLSYQGDTDTRATNGATGTLLLDPTNIIVVGSGANSLSDVSIFNNNPAIGMATISSSLINGANSNVVLQATDTITFGNDINIANSGISLTAQAGNSIFVGSSITTNGGDVRLIGNDPTSGSSTGLGNIIVNAPITTNGGAIDIQINNAAGLFINNDLVSGGGNITLGGNSTVAINGTSGVNIGGSGVSVDSDGGNISINGSSTTGRGIFFSGFNSSITADEGSITLTGTSSSGNIANGSGIVIASGSTIAADEGTINISGFSGNATGGSDGVVVESVFGGNSTTISTSSGNINIVGNAVNPLRLGINVRAPFTGGDLILNSGSGDFNFTSDRTELFSNGLQGSGTISLQAFSPNAALTIGGSNVFLGNSFLTSLANSSGFSNVVIGDIADNNAITVAQNSSINTSNFAPITIQTARTFDGNGFTISTNSSQFNLTANQGINSLGNITNNNGGITLFANQNITTGNITSNGNAITITSTSGAISTAGSLTSSPSLGVGNSGAVALTALGNITVGNIFSSTSNGNGGDISIISTGTNGVIAINGVLDSFSTTNGTGGDILLQAAGNITTDDLIISAASNGNGGSISYISSGGSITANQRVRSSSAGNTLANGNGGDILFQAAGDITTSDIISQSTGFGSGGDVTVTTGSGNITVNGNVTSSAFNSSSGNGGNVLFQADGDILVTGNIDPSANASPADGTEGQVSITSNAGSISLQDLVNNSSVELVAEQDITTGNITTIGTGNITITSNAGSIDTSLGSVTNNANGDSGEITFLALGNITTGAIDSFSLFGRPGSVSLTSTTGLISLGGNISTTSLFGGDTDVNNVGNITLTGNVSILSPITLSTQDDDIGGNINLANANVTGNQLLRLTAGSGTVNLGVIGTSDAPLASLFVFSPNNIGNIVLNGDIFTFESLFFDAPVTLANNVAISTSSGAINFNSTINGNRSLSLDAGNSSIFFNGLVGNINPLASLTANSLIESTSGINIRALGNISTRAIGNFSSPVNIDIQTAGTFTSNGSTIESSNLNLSANQGINALGDIFSNGGNVDILSSLGSINSEIDSRINTVSFSDPFADSGNISITAISGSLNLQELNTRSSGDLTSRGGNINLRVTGNNSISVRDINTSTSGNTTGNAGTVIFEMGSGTINLVGNVINLSSQNGSSSNLTFNNPVVVNSSTFIDDGGATISGLIINTTGGTGSGNIFFNSTFTSPNASDVTINSGLGNVTFNNAIASSGQPLGNFQINSSGTTTFANTVFANSIVSNLSGNTVINADLVATGANGFISLGNFTANGTISLVGNEINLNGIASGTGDLTLKPLTTSQAIAIGGTGDSGTGTLDILNSDLNAFVNGTFNSLIIGNLNGSGGITLLGNAEFFQPTTLQSPVGGGFFFSNGFNITGVDRLGIEVGSSITISNSSFAPSLGNTLNVRLNADRDVSGNGTISLFSSSINTGGENITLGGGLNPVIDPAIATGNTAGVTINSSTLNAQGGNIFVNGRNTSTFGTGNNGILITRFSPSQPTSNVLTSGLGTITLVGTNANVGLSNSDGISIESGSVVESVNGNISLVGVGGNGSTFNDGIEIESNSLIRTIGTGNVSIIGDTLSTGIDNRDVNISGSIVETLGTGAISIASSPSTPRLLQIANSSINPTAVGGSGTVTLESEAIELLGTTRIRGVGNLIIQPTFSSTGIRLGGAVNDTNLNLSSSELATIQDGFSQILIGRLDTAGLIFLSDNVSFSDPVTLRSQGIGGAINTSGFNFTSTGAVNFLANQNITTGNITALGNNLSLISSLGAINTSQGLLNTSSTTGNGGDISLLSPSINTNLGSINASSTIGNAGNLSFANVGNGLVTIAGTDINLSSGNGVAGSLNFLAPVVISSPSLTIDTSSSAGTSGTVTFSNNLNGAIANANSLTVNAGNGNVNFNAIGNNTALGDLTVNTTGLTNFNSAVRANSLSTNLGGTTTISGDISTNGSQIYNDAVSLAANAQPSTILSTVNNDITFNGTVNGNQALTLNAGSGNITFGSTVGNTSTLGNIIANSSAFTNFNGVVNATTVTTDLGGATNVNANITTAATQTYGDNVNLGIATIFTANNATITFNGDINGNQALRVLSGSADINFRGTVNTDNLIAESSGITRFNTVNAVGIFTDELGSTELNGNVTTTGTVIFNDVVNLLSAIQLNTGGAIAFNNNVSGNQNLTINSGTNSITFGGTTTVNNLIANSTATTRFNTVSAGTLVTNAGGITELNGNITTTGAVTFNDAVSLLSAIQFNAGGAISFINNVNGNQDLTINSGANNITFGGTAIVNNLIANSTGTTRFNTVNAGSLLTNAGGTTELSGNITTTGAVTFNDAVSLLNTIQFNTGGAIAFNNDLTGNQDLTINNGANNITFGGTTTVNNLIANSTGTTRFNNVNTTSLLTNAGGTSELSGNITTTGAVTFNDAVNLLSAVQFNTGGAIAFNNTVTGNQNLTLNVGANNITFGGAATVNDLIANSTGTTRFNTINAASLLTNAGGTTELNGNVTTTGAVTFNDAVNLLSAIQFNTGGAIAFINNVNGNQDLTLNSGTNNITFGGTTAVNNLIANSTGTTRFNTINSGSLLTNAGGTTELSGNITTTGAVTFNDAVNLLSTVQFNTGGAIAFNNDLTGNQNLTLSNGANNITFGGTTTVNNLIANSTGTTRFNNVNATSLLTNAGGTTQLNGTINTSGTQTYNDAVVLLGTTQLNATNSAVLFNTTVDGTQDLTVNSGSGNITFNGAVGSSAILNNLTANSTGVTRFNSSVNAGSILSNAGGTTELNGNVTTTSAVTFNDAVNLLSTVQFNTGGAIAFNNNISGNQDLTLNSGANNITFGGTTAVNNLIANSTGTTRFNTVNAASLLTNAGGTTELNGNVTTTGAATFNDAVNLLSTVQFNTGGAIAFNNDLNGNQDLTLNSGANNITFGGTTTVNNLIANSTGTTRFNTVNAASLTSNAGGTTELNGNVTTTGAVTFNDAVNLLSAIQFDTGGAIAFNNNVSGNQDLNLNSGANNITFSGTTTVNNLIANSTGTTRFNTVNAASLITNAGGTTELNGNVTTTGAGAVTFNDAVNLLSTVQFNTGGAIAFNNDLTGNQDLTLSNGANNITFGGTTTVNNLIANSTGTTIFNIVNANSLLTDVGGTTQLNGNVTTINSQTYNDAVNLTNPVQLTTTNSQVRFNEAITGNQDLTVNSGSGNVTIAGNNTSVNNLVVNSTGTTQLNGLINSASILTNAGGTTELNGTINSTSGQTFNDSVVLIGATQLNSVDSAIAFNSSVNGNQNLTINSGAGDINFNSDVGNTAPIGNLTANSAGVTRFNTVNAASLTTDINGTTELNGNVTTTGSQTYNDAVVLNNSIQLNTTDSAVTFSNSVNGNQDLTINTGSGDITFSSPATVRSLTTNSSGITRIDRDINAVSFTTAFEGSTLLLGNVFTSGNQTYNNKLLISANTILDSSSGNGNISFLTVNNAIAGTPSNLTLNAGTGNISFGISAGSLGDRLGDITVQNANEFTGSGIIANSLTQNAGIGATQFSNDNEFTGNLNITSQSFSLTEGANLRVGNANIQAVNGVDLSVATNFSFLGAGVINIDSDSNSDGIGTFLSRGTITDNGLGGVVNIRTANPDIRNVITASQISLAPSVANTSIAIGSVANGDFKLQDFALDLLQASLVTIQANGSPVSIGSNNASFATGTSLEIGTANSPATSISAIAGFTLNVDRNLSLTGNTIQLGDTNVGGDLALRFTESVSQVGTIAVTGSTNLIVDSNPLTDVLLADFANSFGNQIVFTFINLPNDDFQNFEIRDITENANLAFFPNQVNNLKLILDNGTIDLPSIPLTGSLTLQARQVSLNGDITTTNANLSGDLINLNRNLTTSGNLTINNASTLKISTETNLDITGNLEQIGDGSVQLGGNIVRAASVSFAQDIELIGDSSITSDGIINFDGNVNGLFTFILDASGNFVVAKGGFGTTNPLQSLAIALDSTLVSQVNSRFSPTDINIATIGDVNVGNITNNGRDIKINSADGLIATGNIDSSFTFSIGDGGNVNLSAEGDVTTGSINTSSFGNAGEVSLESRSGVISTGDINASGAVGGRVFFNAATAINAGQISTRGFEGAGGDVILDPLGDVVVESIETSGLTGGNVTLISTGGNLRITDVLNNPSSLATCLGASICTSGSNTSGTISLRTGGLNPFTVGDASVNGSLGVLTTGQSTLTVGTSIPVIADSTFSQNGIFISPGGFLPVDPESPNNRFEPPKNLPPLINQPPNEEKVLSVRDVLISEADRYFREGNLAKAFEVIEKAYVSQLELFTGNTIDSEAITIENTQDLLSTVVQQTGDVAALIYPVLLNDRIEILVIPPKEKGKPFSRASIATNQEQIETVVTDYRNNLRDVGSNDYLEQSQQLYDWVIRPIKQQLEAMKVDTLVFVMDGGLRVTPPSALHDGKQFLIENYAIASIPALRVTRIEERDRKATRVLAMGLTESVAGFSALPSVDIEIKTIASEVLNGDAFLNEEFTVDNLQTQRQRGIYNILHLGTHAKFVSDTSKDSFIQFWDSRLSLKDIPQLRFDSPVIDMLALSACQTAVGNNLGISGLAVESGARSVLASLWEVSDAGTAPLMISFYTAFPDAVNKAQAMRKAQIELLQGRVSVSDGQILGIEGIPSIPLPVGLTEIDLKHPFYWSSFILVGNWL
ncbi:MAG: hypothetical protein DCE90_09860 [Pseudanabaena sp.]|nr:MAG: hypothetical protein DCE90_09860 [Pseudanabaena sp.]